MMKTIKKSQWILAKKIKDSSVSVHGFTDNLLVASAWCAGSSDNGCYRTEVEASASSDPLTMEGEPS